MKPTINFNSTIILYPFADCKNSKLNSFSMPFKNCKPKSQQQQQKKPCKIFYTAVQLQDCQWEKQFGAVINSGGTLML